MHFEAVKAKWVLNAIEERCR